MNLLDRLDAEERVRDIAERYAAELAYQVRALHRAAEEGAEVYHLTDAANALVELSRALKRELKETLEG